MPEQEIIQLKYMFERIRSILERNNANLDVVPGGLRLRTGVARPESINLTIVETAVDLSEIADAIRANNKAVRELAGALRETHREPPKAEQPATPQPKREKHLNWDPQPNFGKSRPSKATRHRKDIEYDIHHIPPGPKVPM